MTDSNSNTQNAGVRQIMWLPRRLSGTTWDEVGSKLNIIPTGRTSTDHQAACEVTLPAGWHTVPSQESPQFKLWLVDESGKRRAALFYKEYRADFMQLAEG